MIRYFVFGLTLLFSSQAYSQTYNLTLAGASPGGLWSSIGLGIDRVIAKEYPGSTVTYQTSSGGLANAKNVSDKKVQLGIAADMELAAAYNGTGIFAGKPLKDLRVLFRTYSPSARFQVHYFLINKKVADQYSIRTFSDLKKNANNLTAVVNRAGNMDADISLAVYKMYGIDNFKNTIRAGGKEFTPLMKDRRVDILATGISFNDKRIREMQQSMDFVQLGMSENEANQIASLFSADTCQFKKNEHSWLKSDIWTVCVGTVVFAHKDMTNRDAYNITKAMMKNIKVYKNIHPALKKAFKDSDLSQSSVVSFHSGSIRAFAGSK